MARPLPILRAALNQRGYPTAWRQQSTRAVTGDAGLSPEDTSSAYCALYEQGFIERVDALTEGQEDALALRLLVDDFNDRKHRTPFREESFGFPGARVGGKSTIGNVFLLPVSPFVERSIAGWPAFRDDERASLRRSLQEVAGKDRAYIEEAKVVSGDGDGDGTARCRWRSSCASPWRSRTTSFGCGSRPLRTRGSAVTSAASAGAAS